MLTPKLVLGGFLLDVGNGPKGAGFLVGDILLGPPVNDPASKKPWLI